MRTKKLDSLQPKRTGSWRPIALLLIVALLLPGSLAGAREPGLAEVPVPALDRLVVDGQDRLSARSNPKLDPALNQLLQVWRADGMASARAFAERRAMVLQDESVQVILVAGPAAIPRLVAVVEGLGGEIQGDYQDLLQALVPVDALEPLAGRPDVRRIRDPLRAIELELPTVGNATTEGLAASNAAAWHAAGTDGAGVRVAVIDGGFAGYSPLLGSDLPGTVGTYDWTGSGMAGTEHGTACAEIVHDMAPGATIDLHKVSTVVDLSQAVTQAIADGVDVISMSVSWVLDGPGDGTGPLADLVQTARASGIFWAMAAGNGAEVSWAGAYDDYYLSANEMHLHDWDGTGLWFNFLGPGNGNCYVFPAGTPLQAGLHWDDWGAVDQDYDLHLARWPGTGGLTLVASSDSPQNGGVGQTPEEFISHTAVGGNCYAWLVERVNSDRDVCLGLSAPQTVHLDQWTPERSLTFPADSPDVIAVGAVDVDSPYPLESYSSRGPTFGPGGACSGGAIKPDLTAYANVSTVTYGAGTFAGTSPAAPHVAGAAALVMQRYPAYTVTQVQDYLEDQALDLGTAGKDTLYGAGRLHLPDSTAPDIEVTPTSFDETVNKDGTVVRTLTIGNVGQGALTFSLEDVEAAANLSTRLEPPDREEESRQATPSTAGMTYQIDVGSVADCPWLSQNPTSGTVLSGESLPVEMTLNATGLDLGDYACDLIIDTNDPDEDPVTVPVVLHVVSEAPAITSITPDSGSNDGVVSITDLAGSNFQPGATARLARSGQADINATNIMVVSSSQITCDFDLTGAAVGDWDVVVTNPDSQSGTLAAGFAVTGAAAPQVDSITPDSGSNDGVVSITDLAGSNFQPGATARLARTGQADIDATNVVVVNSSQITCDFDLSGAAVGDWDVVVTNPDSQSATLAAGFTVTGAAAPQVDSITPDSGSNDGVVSITDLAGSNFQPGATARLARSGQADINATDLVVVSSSQITCDFDLTGAAAGDWDVVVTNPDSQSGTLAVGFTVTLPAGEDHRAYLPLVLRRWPPLPAVPYLHEIDNADGDGEYLVAWNAALGADTYTLEEDTEGTFSSPTVRYSGPGTNAPISAQPEGAYYYRVKATNAWGDSGWSATRSVQVGGAPSAPLLNPIDNGDGDGSFTVSWSSVSRATSYVLEEDDNGAFSSPASVYTGAGTSFPVTGKGAGTYFYRVKATNSWGESAWSNVESVAVASAPEHYAGTSPTVSFDVIQERVCNFHIRVPFSSGYCNISVREGVCFDIVDNYFKIEMHYSQLGVTDWIEGTFKSGRSRVTGNYEVSICGNTMIFPPSRGAWAADRQ